jgi:hypothetical protein
MVSTDSPPELNKYEVVSSGFMEPNSSSYSAGAVGRGSAVESAPGVEESVVDKLEEEAEQAEEQHQAQQPVQLEPLLEGDRQEDVFPQQHDRQVLRKQDALEQGLAAGGRSRPERRGF